MRKIGITGTIASGKSEFCKMLKGRGFPVFNSDRYAAMALHAGNPICTVIKEAFPGVEDEHGDVDHARLAAIVFSDEEKRKKLNSLVHPYVIDGMRKFFESHADLPVAFAEVPLLFEAGLQNEFDSIITVTCEKETAVERMMRDRNYTREDALARYASQIDKEKQIAMSDRVIHNDGTKRDLEKQVNTLVRKYREEMRRNEC